MRVPVIRMAVAAWLAIGILGFAVPAPAFAEESAKVSKELAKPLIAAQAAMKANDFATALVHVREAQAVPNRTPFDDFTINEFLANIAIAQKDYATAATAYQAMADSPALPADKKVNTLTNAVLLASNENQPENVIRYAEQLQALGPLDPKIDGPLAVAYYNKGEAAKALAIATLEMNAATAAGQAPDQGVLDIMARTQLKQNDLAGATTTLETLVRNYGDPNDWAQLIDMSFAIKGLRDIDALNLYRLRMATNAVTALDDYAIMAQVASKQGYPGETVAMLEHGIAAGAIGAGDKAGALLPAARQKEVEDKRTLASFDAEARVHKTGDYDVKLAETYYGYARYAEAEEAARRAISKGGTKDPQEAPLVLGMALAREGKSAEAVDVLSHVSGNAANDRIAHLWTLYAQRKYGVAAAAH